MSNPQDARFLQRFFKTGPGEYAEGDVFLGIRVPATRRLIARYRGMPLSEVEQLLHSREHEARLLALLLLVDRYRRAPEERAAVFDLYLRNTQHINNWDLVDSSAPQIMGAHLHETRKSVLLRLARSPDLWERRIAMVATQYFIKHGELRTTLQLAGLLLGDTHDLIHKAVGWMLREVGQQDRAVLEAFLREHAGRMPRTALRYATEKFSPEERRKFR